MNTDRKRGPTARKQSPGYRHPTARQSRPVVPKTGFCVQTWKESAGAFRPYQTYEDESAALHVKDQLEWVGARVRIVRA